MNPLLLRIAPYAIGLLLLAAGALFAYKAGQNSRQADWDNATAEQVAAQLAKNQADNAKLKSLEETKNANTIQLDKLRADNHALWLRLPKTPCAGAASPTSADSASAVGELPTQGERDLAEAKRQLDDEAYRADAIVEACRVLNGMN